MSTCSQEETDKSTASLDRQATSAEYCHERLGPKFAEALSTYDTQQRVQLLVDDFLTDEMLQGKRILDVGCGLGYFSERLVERGAEVVACDLGPSLVAAAQARAGCAGEVADILCLVKKFGAESFDGVVSSECIEHTPDPRQAIKEMVQIVRRGGFLSISTPNILWSPVVHLATYLRLRPFDGHENFSSWRGLRKALRTAGAEPIREQGLHLFPFQIPLHGLSRWCDRNLQQLKMLMINICILARRS